MIAHRPQAAGAISAASNRKPPCQAGRQAADRAEAGAPARGMMTLPIVGQGSQDPALLRGRARNVITSNKGLITSQFLLIGCRIASPRLTFFWKSTKRHQKGSGERR